MRIESFHIQGFKSIADVKVEGLSDINIFFGLNDVGKSNIFQALKLWWCYLMFIPESLDELLDEFSTPIFNLNGINKTSIRVVISIKESEAQGMFPSDYWQSKQLIVITHVEITPQTMQANAYISTRRGEFGLKTRDLQPLLPNFHIIEATRRFQVEKWEQNKGLSLVNDKNLKRAFFYTYLSRNFQQKQQFEAIRRILAEPPYNLGSLDVALDPDNDRIDIGFIRDNGRLPIENLGSGSQQLLLMLGQVFLNDYPIIALEEPEMNLSPQYQGLLLSTLRQLMQDPAVKLNQLFISTHSPYLEFQENFYDVTRNEEGHTQVRRASRENHQAYFAITPTGPDTGARINSLNQVKLYDRMMEEMALQRGDLVFFLKNENGRWEVRPETDVLPEVDEALDGSAKQ